jgi:chromosome segregation ATPase
MIVDKIKDQIVDAIDMAEADKKSIRTQLEDSKNALESFNIKINMINTKYEELVKIPENVNHQLKQLLEEISEFIDKKITDKMSALNVVNEKSDSENTSKKLKLTDLLVLKENFDPKDLIEFRKVGMI